VSGDSAPAKKARDREGHVRKFIGIVLVASLPSVAVAAEGLDWAYPPTPKPEPLDTVVLKQMPGSDKQYTQAQIDDPFNPPDWFPGDHPAMPPIVANGAKPAVRACALCHLPTGAGHPESSGLAGLPANYIVRQMAEFKTGHRKGVRTGVMIGFANAISDADARAAAEYFASLKPRPWTKVVETDTVPQTYIGPGAMRFATPGGGTEPIGNRIIVVPQDPARASSRDARSGFIDYVPTGSIKRGEALVTTGGDGKTVPCAICHGPTYKGLAEIPPLAGSTGIYLVRQLNDMQTGARTGVQVELMKQVVAKLSADDMVAIAAYLASREP
jgi:cytochrome c553